MLKNKYFKREDVRKFPNLTLEFKNLNGTPFLEIDLYGYNIRFFAKAGYFPNDPIETEKRQAQLYSKIIANIFLAPIFWIRILTQNFDSESGF